MNDNEMNDTDFERQLRESLHRDAERITPRDRRTEILAMVHDDRRLADPRRRWLIPVAAAASVALIGGAIAFGVSNTGDRRQAAPAAPSTSTSSTTAPT